MPRYPAIFARLGINEVAISRTPTHVVIAAADLMESATRGGDVKRLLPVGTTVTVIKPEGDWAYIATDGIAVILQTRLLKLD